MVPVGLGSLALPEAPVPSEALFVTGSNDHRGSLFFLCTGAPRCAIGMHGGSSGITDAKGTASSAGQIVRGEFWYGQVASQDVLGGGEILAIS